jgi:hypothetical protein
MKKEIEAIPEKCMICGKEKCSSCKGFILKVVLKDNPNNSGEYIILSALRKKNISPEELKRVLENGIQKAG